MSIEEARAVATAYLPDEDEASQVVRIRAGDEAACEALYLRYHGPLWRFAYGFVGSRDVAEDIVQDVFLALWRGRVPWDVANAPRAWLYGAVRHRALYHLRHARDAARDDAGVEPATAADGGPEVGATGALPADVHDALEAGDIDAAVMRAVAALPPRRRLAMTLHWRHALSSAEIARVLGTTDASVRVLLTHACVELAALLDRIRR